MDREYELFHPNHHHGPHEVHGPEWVDERRADSCDDQLPNISRVGRGLKGDSYRVEISDPDTESETYLHGSYIDSHSGEITTDWVSENINGGQLTFDYKIRAWTDPQTFTMTFAYHRPGRDEWKFTTPPIPFSLVTGDDAEGNFTSANVSTLYLKKTTDDVWVEKLLYPSNMGPSDFNTPGPEEPWTVNLTYGIGGDMDVPNLDDLAKIIGTTPDVLKDIIANKPAVLNGSDNVKDYVDDKLKHIHEDMGFGTGLMNDGNSLGSSKNTIKKYIDQAIAENDAKWRKAVGAIINKVYGGGSLAADGSIKWNQSQKIPVGDLNIFGVSNPSNTTYSNAIRSRALSNNDIKAV